MIARICQAVSSSATAGSSVTGTSRSVDTLRVPPRCSVAEAPTASQRSSPSAASDTAVPPAETTSCFVLVSGSIDVIESSNSFATQMNPAASASELGPSPTGITAVSRPVAGSRRETVPSRWLATQIAPSADSTAVGPLPTLFAKVTLRRRGSTRATPVGIERDPDTVRGERDAGRASGERDRLARTRCRVEPHERRADRVGDPQRPGPICEPTRPRADRQRLGHLVDGRVDAAHGSVRWRS